MTEIIFYGYRIIHGQDRHLCHMKNDGILIVHRTIQYVFHELSLYSDFILHLTYINENSIGNKDNGP